MLRVPLNGLTKAMYVPSGEIWAPAISGSPKNASRSITGGVCAQTGAESASSNSVESISRPINERRERINTSFVVGMVDRVSLVNEGLFTQTDPSGFQSATNTFKTYVRRRGRSGPAAFVRRRSTLCTPEGSLDRVSSRGSF